MKLGSTGYIMWVLTGDVLLYVIICGQRPILGRSLQCRL